MEPGPRSEYEERESAERWSAAMSYLAVLCWVPYFLWADRPFVRFHAKQGVALFLTELLGAFVVTVLDLTLGRIPFLGLILIFLIRLGFFLLLLALSILGFSRALAGEQLALPWLGRFGADLPDPPFQLKI